MSQSDKAAIETITHKLGYKFTNEKLLEEALTHSSYINENHDIDRLSYERLEFLGDAILDLVVGNYLYRNYPNMEEGAMSYHRARIVNEKSFASFARKIDLGNNIFFGRGEIQTNGNEKDSILADVLEAVFGAIFIDSNLETVDKVFFDLYLNDIKAIIKSDEKFIDYKSQFLELVQNQKLGHISYNYEYLDGGKFIAKLFLDNEHIANGQGETKKEAEKLASKIALQLYEGLRCQK